MTTGPRKTCIHQVFRNACARHGDAVAVTGSAERWTYGELDSIAQRIAGGLAAAGVGPGGFVPVFVGRSPWFIAAVLGVLKRGAAYVPIDSTLPIERQQAMVRDLGATVGIGGVNTASVVGGAIRLIGVEELAAAAPIPDVPVEGDAPAYVMYTSGSTGRPKGTVIPHRGIVRLVCGADFADFGPEHIWAVMSSVSFDASTLEIWGALLNGGCCAVVDDGLASIDRIAEVFAERRVTDAWFTAALFNTIVDYRVDMFSGMAQVLTGGEAESPKHFRRFLEACPGVRLIHGYGPTENTTFSLCHTVRVEDVAAGDRIPIGKPIRGTEILILGSDGLECADGTIGELYVGGEGVGLGYLGQEELTRAKFVAIEGKSGTWYRTGDLVRRRRDGAVLYLGRVDRQVKIRGFRIEPEEVERIIGECPAVSGVSVGSAGDTSEEKRLVAYCAVAGETCVEQAEEIVRDWARVRLPSYMIPDELRIVRELPRTANGKVDRERLDRANRGGAIESAGEGETGYMGEEAAALAAIWTDLLPGVRVTRSTDFFAAGGHSVLVLKMIAELRRRLNRMVAPSVVYQERTFGRIAEAVRASRTAAQESPQAAATTVMEHACGRVQSGLLYEWWRDPSSSLYHVFSAFVVDPGFDAGAFALSLEGSIAAHDALRSVFYMGEDGPRQKFRERLPLEEVIRDEEATDWDGAGAMPEGVLARIREPFDVAIGPLIRVHIFPMEGERNLVVIVVHHAIMDEWSLDLLLHELGGARPVPPRSISAYVEWERQHLELDEARRRGQEFATAMKSRYAAKIGGPAAAIERRFDLGDELSRRVEECAVSLATTPFVVLLSAYAATLASWRGIPDPWIVTPFANRSNAELRGVVGCCIDLRLLRLPLGSSEAFSVFAGRTNEMVVREHDLGPVPLDEIAAVVRNSTGLSIDACMRYAITYRVGAMRARQLGGKRALPVAVPAARAKFGLLAQFEREEDSLGCVLEASADDLGADDLKHFEAELRDILTRVTRDPGAHLKASAAVSSQRSIGPCFSPPRESIGHGFEGESTRAWSLVLGVASPKPSDNFFRSGGTSLMLIRFSAELTRRTGRSIDVGAFLDDPILGRVAGLLNLREDPSVVTFSGGGSGFVVIAFPGNLGPATACYTLAKELQRVVPDGYEFVGVDLRMLRDEGADFARAMESLATTLERRVFDRPFAMVGSSLGGIVAFDLAARLERRGLRSERLWLLDSYVPERRGLELVRAGVAGAWLLTRSPLTFVERVRRRLPGRARPRPAAPNVGSTPADGLENCEWRGPSARVSMGIASKLLRGYVPKVISTDVDAFRSIHRSRPLGTYFRSRTCGWGRYVSGSTKGIALDISHAEFMSGSGVGEVAKIIGKDLKALLREHAQPGEEQRESHVRNAAPVQSKGHS